MQAITFEKYGGPEVLRLSERPKPTPGQGEVLVRVRAASLNAMDRRLMRADPLLVRCFNGLLVPKQRALGADVAGVVEAVGPGVRRLAPGQAVFGFTSKHARGGLAEYVALPERALARKPDGLGFEQAAAVVLAGFTALQAVRERARLRPGDAVLIQGAGGGVGTLLVQVAKAYGARVTAVCGPRSAELVRSLGADRLLDRTRHDVRREGARYDAIFGVHGYQALAAYRDGLKPGGTYVMVGGESRQLYEAMLLGRWAFARSGKRIELLQLDEERHADDLEELCTLIAAGRLRPVLDRVYPLEQTAEAMRHLERAHVRGKLVVRVAEA